jgi:hypothetical protein
LIWNCGFAEKQKEIIRKTLQKPIKCSFPVHPTFFPHHSVSHCIVSPDLVKLLRRGEPEWPGLNMQLAFA